MKKAYYVASLALLTAIVFSCKKNKNSSRTEIILGKWKYTQFIHDLNNNRVIDDTAWTVPDSIYAFYDFHSNGVVEYGDGDSTISGMWGLTANETKLWVGANTDTVSYDLTELTGSKLTLGTYVVNSSYGWFVFNKQ